MQSSFVRGLGNEDDSFASHRSSLRARRERLARREEMLSTQETKPIAAGASSTKELPSLPATASADSAPPASSQAVPLAAVAALNGCHQTQLPVAVPPQPALLQRQLFDAPYDDDLGPILTRSRILGGESLAMSSMRRSLPARTRSKEGRNWQPKSPAGTAEACVNVSSAEPAAVGSVGPAAGAGGRPALSMAARRTAEQDNAAETQHSTGVTLPRDSSLSSRFDTLPALAPSLPPKTEDASVPTAVPIAHEETREERIARYKEERRKALAVRTAEQLSLTSSNAGDSFTSVRLLRPSHRPVGKAVSAGDVECFNSVPSRSETAYCSDVEQKTQELAVLQDVKHTTRDIKCDPISSVLGRHTRVWAVPEASANEAASVENERRHDTAEKMTGTSKQAVCSAAAPSSSFLNGRIRTSDVDVGSKADIVPSPSVPSESQLTNYHHSQSAPTTDKAGYTHAYYLSNKQSDLLAAPSQSSDELTIAMAFERAAPSEKLASSDHSSDRGQAIVSSTKPLWSIADYPAMASEAALPVSALPVVSSAMASVGVPSAAAQPVVSPGMHTRGIKDAQPGTTIRNSKRAPAVKDGHATAFIDILKRFEPSETLLAALSVPTAILPQKLKTTKVDDSGSTHANEKLTDSVHEERGTSRAIAAATALSISHDNAAASSISALKDEASNSNGNEGRGITEAAPTAPAASVANQKLSDSERSSLLTDDDRQSERSSVGSTLCVPSTTTSSSNAAPAAAAPAAAAAAAATVADGADWLLAPTQQGATSSVGQVPDPTGPHLCGPEEGASVSASRISKDHMVDVGGGSPQVPVESDALTTKIQSLPIVSTVPAKLSRSPSVQLRQSQAQATVGKMESQLDPQLAFLLQARLKRVSDSEPAAAAAAAAPLHPAPAPAHAAAVQEPASEETADIGSNEVSADAVADATADRSLFSVADKVSFFLKEQQRHSGRGKRPSDKDGAAIAGPFQSVDTYQREQSLNKAVPEGRTVASGRWRQERLSKRERSQTQPVTCDEVLAAQCLGDVSNCNANNTKAAAGVSDLGATFVGLDPVTINSLTVMTLDEKIRLFIERSVVTTMADEVLQASDAMACLPQRLRQARLGLTHKARQQRCLTQPLTVSEMREALSSRVQPWLPASELKSSLGCAAGNISDTRPAADALVAGSAEAQLCPCSADCAAAVVDRAPAAVPVSAETPVEATYPHAACADERAPTPSEQRLRKTSKTASSGALTAQAPGRRQSAQGETRSHPSVQRTVCEEGGCSLQIKETGGHAQSLSEADTKGRAAASRQQSAETKKATADRKVGTRTSSGLAPPTGAEKGKLAQKLVASQRSSNNASDRPPSNDKNNDDDRTAVPAMDAQRIPGESLQLAKNSYGRVIGEEVQPSETAALADTTTYMRAGQSCSSHRSATAKNSDAAPGGPAAGPQSNSSKAKKVSDRISRQSIVPEAGHCDDLPSYMRATSSYAHKVEHLFAESASDDDSQSVTSTTKRDHRTSVVAERPMGRRQLSQPAGQHGDVGTPSYARLTKSAAAKDVAQSNGCRSEAAAAVGAKSLSQHPERSKSVCGADADAMPSYMRATASYASKAEQQQQQEDSRTSMDSKEHQAGSADVPSSTKERRISRTASCATGSEPAARATGTPSFMRPTASYTHHALPKGFIDKPREASAAHHLPPSYVPLAKSQSWQEARGALRQHREPEFGRSGSPASGGAAASRQCSAAQSPEPLNVSEYATDDLLSATPSPSRHRGGDREVLGLSKAEGQAAAAEELPSCPLSVDTSSSGGDHSSAAAHAAAGLLLSPTSTASPAAAAGAGGSPKAAVSPVAMGGKIRKHSSAVGSNASFMRPTRSSAIKDRHSQMESQPNEQAAAPSLDATAAAAAAAAAAAVGAGNEEDHSDRLMASAAAQEGAKLRSAALGSHSVKRRKAKAALRTGSTESLASTASSKQDAKTPCSVTAAAEPSYVRQTSSSSSGGVQAGKVDREAPHSGTMAGDSRHMAIVTNASAKGGNDASAKLKKFGVSYNLIASTTAGTKSCDEGSNLSVAERLALLQKSGSEEWKKRLTKEIDVKEERDGGGSSSGACVSATSIADRLSKMQEHSQRWHQKKGVENDAVQFTVEAKLANHEAPVLSSPLVASRQRAVKRASSLKLKPAAGAENGQAGGNNSRPKTMLFTRSPVAATPGHQAVRVVKVPSMDDLSSFFTPGFPVGDDTELSPESDLSDLTASLQVLSSVQRIKPKRNNRGVARNPVRALLSRNDLCTEYTEVTTCLAEAYANNTAKTPPTPHGPQFAREALAGLASKENFKKIALKKMDIHEAGALLGGKEMLPYKEMMLLQVKGRRHIQTRLVEPCASSINSGDCFLLVLKDNIFVWFGEFANVVEKNKASELASFIQATKDLGCKSAQHVLEIDERRSPSHASAKQFWNHLGGMKDCAKTGPPEEDELYEQYITQTNMIYIVKNDELLPLEQYVGELPKYEMLDEHEVLVFDFGTELYVWYGKEVPLNRRGSALQLAKQLFDQGYDYTECNINPMSPLLAHDKGGMPLKSKRRPEWCLLAKVNQNMETALFKEKFDDWPPEPLRTAASAAGGTASDKDRDSLSAHSSKTSSCSNIAAGTAAYSSADELKPYDAKLMLGQNYLPVTLVLENTNVGRGDYWCEFEDGLRKEYRIETTDVRMWQVLDYEKRELTAPSSYGQFYSAETYVVCWQYIVKQLGVRNLKGNASKHQPLLGRERRAYFFWRGEDSTINQKGALALMTVELDKGDGPQIPVEQGQEPACFLRLFNGKMAVHRGKSQTWTSSGQQSTGFVASEFRHSMCRLYIVRHDIEREACLLEVEPLESSLRSQGCFILVSHLPHSSSCHLRVWFGSHSSDASKQTAQAIAQHIVSSCPSEFGVSNLDGVGIPVTVCSEGHSDVEFRKALRLNGPSQDGACCTLGSGQEHAITGALLQRLFHMSSASGKFTVKEIVSTSRPDHSIPSLSDDSSHSTDSNSPVLEAAATQPFPFAQSQLYGTQLHQQQPALFLVDGGLHLYLWQGWWPPSDELDSDSGCSTKTESALMRFAAERRLAAHTALSYMKEKLAREGNAKCGCDLVYAGYEPPSFIHLFPTWTTNTVAAQCNAQDKRISVENLDELVACWSRCQYSFADLKNRPLPDGVDSMKLETYLPDSEFQEIMKMTREEYASLPIWKQVNLKKEVGLY